MTAAVSAGREFRPFQSPSDRARNVANQRSYDEDEEGLVAERPLRNSQRSDGNANSEHSSSNHSRKRPRSLPPQDYSYRQQREPKSEPWVEGGRRPTKQQAEDFHLRSSHSQSHRDSNNSNSDRDNNNMCNTPFRRNGAATYRSRHNNRATDFRDSNRGQYDYNQGPTNAPRQEHRWQEREEADFWSNNRGEDRGRVNDGAAYNRILPLRNEGGSGYRRAWDDRRTEDRKDWGDRRGPGDRGEYNESRPGIRRDWNERRNNSNQYQDRQAQFQTPYDDRSENGHQDWRSRNEQERPSGRFNSASPQQSRFPQDRRYRSETPRHQDDHYRNERSQDQSFYPHKANSWDESYSNNGHSRSRPSLNEVSRPTRSDDRFFDGNYRPYNDFSDRDPRPPPSPSPQTREYNQSAPAVHDYRRHSYDHGNSGFDRYQSRDEYHENVSTSRHDSDDRYVDRNRQFGYEQGRYVDSNLQANRTDIQQRSEQVDRRYEYSNKTNTASPVEKQTTPAYTAPITNNKAIEEKAAASAAPISKSTPKPALVTTKPVAETKKVEPVSKTTVGIPMSWLKPKAKPKKPIQKIVVNKDEKQSINKLEAEKIPRVKLDKGSGLTMSPPHQSPLANRMVTDSEGGSTLSTMKDIAGESIERSLSKPKVPSAIVTKSPANSKVETADDELLKSDNDSTVDDANSDTKPRSGSQDSTESSSASVNSSASDDSDTDDEEVMMWASKMFGVPFRPGDSSSSGLPDVEEEPSPSKKLRLKLKLQRTETQPEGVMKDVERPRKKKKTKKQKRKRIDEGSETADKDEVVLPLKKRKGKLKKRDSTELDLSTYEDTEEDRMRKESAKPLTADQIKAILGEDDFAAPEGSNWVRRSVRQPSKALLNAKPLRLLVEKLKNDDPDVVVLKMKKFINDPNAPSVVLDAALDALEENTNCQSLYIQVRSHLSFRFIDCSFFSPPSLFDHRILMKA